MNLLLGTVGGLLVALLSFPVTPPLHLPRSKKWRRVSIFFSTGAISRCLSSILQGVVVTDPISTTTAPLYLQEIRKLTQAPIRYVVYSHHHYDHIEGGADLQGKGHRVRRAPQRQGPARAA